MNNQLSIIPASSESQFEERSFDLNLALFGKEKLQSRLSSLSGKKVFFRSDFSKETIPLHSPADASLAGSAMPYQVKEIISSSPRHRLVVGVDSSCALIGETDEGAIYAGRVAVVYASRSKVIKYCRAGPIIFYLDPTTIRAELGPEAYGKVARLILHDRTLAERFIRTQLERSAQLEASKICSDSLILVDGSLRSSILEPKSHDLKQLERTSEENFNQLVGISKASSVKFLAKTATTLQSLRKGGVFIDVTESVRALIPSIQCRVLLAKFNQNSQVFRVDFSYQNAEDESQVLCDLKFNDIMFRGYPETLRLAHHLSVFDASTVSSVRSYLSSKCGIIHVPSDDLRATILGRLV
ncbi:MAG TPA: DNA double-strand break repair nuclease NurA [Nitrososphaerales archaeon]|nr:DNA double-strand break repair nuclease NurA [Nitrososphaerales archaeon]